MIILLTGKGHRRDADGKYDFERIEAIDAVQLNADMTALLNGETVELPDIQFQDRKAGI